MKTTSSVYFFDDKQQFIRMVTKKYLTQNLQEKEITADKSELLNDKLTVSTVFDKGIEGAAYMAVKENDGTFSLYSILNGEDAHNRNHFVGINFAIRELEGYIVKDIRPLRMPVDFVAKKILEATEGEWRVGYVKPNLPTFSGTLYYVSVKDALKQLQTCGCEILFKCKIENNKITDKYIEIYDQIGTASNKRFVYGSSALSVVKEQDRSQIYTSLIGRGKGEEVGDGYGRRLEFAGIEWKTSANKPVNKPKGQNWIELPEMTAKYGIPLKNGKMRKREGVVIFEDIEDAEELLLNTYNALVEMSRPLVQFKTEVISGDEIGNTIQVHRYDRDYHYRARIFSVSIDRLTGKVSSSIGDNLVKKSSVKVSSDLKFDLDRVEREKPSFTTAEQIAQWQTDIIRGLKGGSYILLTEADLGISEERVPYCSVWMNGKSLETSDHFLVANSEGIGFIDGDFNLDNFHTAWTIDGVFNARYIQVGRLSGEQLYLDLDTGEVFFGKGYIKSTDGSMQINITEGIIEGPIIRSYAYKGVSSLVEIQAGKVRILDNGKNVMGWMGPNTMSGGALVIANTQGTPFAIGTENNSQLGVLLRIPIESTQTNPLMNYYGTHNFSAAKIDTGSNKILRFANVSVNGTAYPGLITNDGGSGVIMSSSELYFMKNRSVWTLSRIVNVIDKLSGLGSVMIPNSVRSDGTIASYYNVYL